MLVKFMYKISVNVQVRNQGPGFGQAQKCGRVKPLMGLLIIYI